MPSLLDIRRRIRAVKSTQQITKAMKMVAASRLRRAQERIQHARPFANEMLRVLNSLATRVDSAAHPLLDERKVPRAGGKALLFVITADRGLCGSFNTNAIKGAGAFIVEDPAREVALGLIGRRGRDYFARRGFDGTAGGGGPQNAGITPPVDYLYEPTPAELFTTLIPRHVEVQVFRALLESNAAFYAAQMTAMDSASRNAADMIDQLTLYMNKVRQAAITREIIEVVSGAGAL